MTFTISFQLERKTGVCREGFAFSQPHHLLVQATTTSTFITFIASITFSWHCYHLHIDMLDRVGDGMDRTNARLNRETDHTRSVSEKAAAGGMSNDYLVLLLFSIFGSHSCGLW